MAINVNGGTGGGRPRFLRMAALSEINVTPFVDVVLLLLLIFMMTAQVMNSDIQVDVPKTKLVRESVRDLPIVKITRDGEVFLNDQRVNINDLGCVVHGRFHGQCSMARPTEHWGNNTPGGGSVMINVMKQVPLPANSGVINPVANDTHSEVPEPKPEKVQQTKVKEPPPDAIP